MEREHESPVIKQVISQLRDQGWEVKTNVGIRRRILGNRIPNPVGLGSSQVDILASRRGKTIVVECKTRAISLADVIRMSNVPAQYKRVICAAAQEIPVAPSAREVAETKGIAICDLTNISRVIGSPGIV